MAATLNQKNPVNGVTDSKVALDELKWIDDDSHKKAPIVFEDFEPRTLQNTVLKKLKENWFVPLGLAATVACLTMGLVSMNRGDSKRQQLFMRGRVGFQCFTFIAMVSTIYFSKPEKKEKSK